MKTCLVLPNFNLGGAEKLGVDLANHLYSRSASVDVFSCSEEGVLRELLDPGITVITANTVRASKSIFALASYFRTHKPDVVFASQAHIGILTMLAAHLSGCRNSLKIIIRESSTPSRNFLQIQGGIRRRVMMSGSKCAYTFADLVIAPSYSVEADLREFLGIRREIEVKYNPIDRQALVSLATQDETELEGFNGMPIVMAVGRLSPEKNFEKLISVFDLVLKDVECRLVILGEGPSREKLEDMISRLGLTKHVFLPGYVANPFYYMNKSAVVVSTSDFEGMPNGLIQAAVLGREVLAMRSPGGTAEVLGEDRLVDSSDVTGFAFKIKNTLAGKTHEPAAILGADVSYDAFLTGFFD